jgi:hypothetical protein
LIEKENGILDDIFGLAETLFVFRHSATGGTGIFHRLQFALADVVCRNVVFTTIFAMQRQIGRIAQMTGVIGNGAAILTGMSHGGPPIQDNGL